MAKTRLLFVKNLNQYKTETSVNRDQAYNKDLLQTILQIPVTNHITKSYNKDLLQTILQRPIIKTNYKTILQSPKIKTYYKDLL